jgi:hypothetical protein
VFPQDVCSTPDVEFGRGADDARPQDGASGRACIIGSWFAALSGIPVSGFDLGTGPLKSGGAIELVGQSKQPPVP